MVRNLPILRSPTPFSVLSNSVGTFTFADLYDTPDELIVQSTRLDFALPDPVAARQTVWVIYRHQLKFLIQIIAFILFSAACCIHLFSEELSGII